MPDKKLITGIQQIGIGIPNVNDATSWYCRHFGMDIKVFEDSATAELMSQYTGGKAHDRTAVLSLNMKGGGGFEIWQFTSREPQPAEFNLMWGDYGINAAKIKSIDVQQSYKDFREAGLNIVNPPSLTPSGNETFFVKDLYGNLFQVIDSFEFFERKTSATTGGVVGAIIGCADIDASLSLYQQLLGYDEIIYDEEGAFEDFNQLPGSEYKFRRVLLRHSKPRKGGFSKLFGPTEIELIQVKEREANTLFEDRYWGDLGFIHLCFDVQGMDGLKKEAQELGYEFTVDSANSFDMGDAAGRFTYIEDPDGTLIEFVETHKVPIVKKLGWYVNMTNRDPEKSLPNWLIKGLKLSRMKE